jgi:hypothetical protein
VEAVSDYSWYIITKEPPRPEPTFLHRVESYFRPVHFATEGEGRSEFGKCRSKRRWIMRRGVLRQRGIDHTFPIADA